MLAWQRITAESQLRHNQDGPESGLDMGKCAFAIAWQALIALSSQPPPSHPISTTIPYRQQHFALILAWFT
jgi:hypothetical protein